MASHPRLDQIRELLKDERWKRLIDDKTKMGRTALHNAAAAGHSAVVHLLLEEEKSKATNEKDILGMTPLHWAIKNKQKECICILLCHSPDLKAQNVFGMDPIDMHFYKQAIS